MVWVHFSLNTNQFLVIILKGYLKIVLIVLSYTAEFFDNFILADELFPKALRSLKTCLLVSNNLWGKLYLLLDLRITFDKRFKVTSIPFYVPDFKLLSCELDNVTFKVLYWAILYWYYIKRK